MGVVHHDDHLADVRAALGVQEAIPRDSLRYGAEVELGWSDSSTRQAFFRELDRHGLDSVCISKHDGSITGGIPSEIVSLPLRPYQMREFLDSLGGIIESLADKGLRTSGCGVHFHASRAPINRDVAWRISQGIMSDRDTLFRWYQAQGRRITMSGPEMKDMSRFHSFLDAVALRRASNYCRRSPGFRSFSALQRHTAHDRAFISGRATPTYEWRLFRTARSKRVLLSQFDLVESMIAFSKDAPQELLGDPYVSSKKKKDIPLCDYYRSRERRDGAYQGARSGGLLRREDLDLVEAHENVGGEYYLPTVELCERMGVRRPSGERDWLILREYGQDPSGRAEAEDGTTGAQNWADHVWPLDAYTDYVRGNAELYPALARRLALERFLPFQKGFAVPDFDTSKEHLAVEPGCKVLVDTWDDSTIHTVVRIDKSDEVGGVYARVESGPNQGHEFSTCLAAITHKCEGALEKGGEQ